MKTLVQFPLREKTAPAARRAEMHKRAAAVGLTPIGYCPDLMTALFLKKSLKIIAFRNAAKNPAWIHLFSLVRVLNAPRETGKKP